jgi:predicted GIY-YIG superfamily endonuclease
LEISKLIADAAILELSKVPLQAKQLLPEYSGIYYVLDETNKVWYIGQAKNLCKRWQGKTHHRIYQLEAQKKKHFTIYYEPVNVSQLSVVEQQRIQKYHPHLNASPVKTKKVRPTETLLRETLAAIAPFAFLLGVEPPRQNVKSQVANYWVKNVAKVFHLNVIHICLDDAALDAIYQPETIEEKVAIEAKPFTSRKAYASQWEVFQLGFNPPMLRLLVNNCVIEVTSWSQWCPQEEPLGLREYFQATLAQESIMALTPESLTKLQQQADKEKSSTFHLQRLNPYTEDAIALFFNDPVDREGIKRDLTKLSEDYKAGRRGTGSRSRPIKSRPINLEFISIEELLISRGIEPQKYSRKGVMHLPTSNRMGLYIQSFGIGNEQSFSVANIARGFIDNQEIRTVSSQFDTIYLLAGVEEKAWLLIEEYLKDFAKPATGLKNGEGFVEKFYVSARKYLVPAKVNIKLENIGYSAWIPFGFSQEFPTFEAAIEEISKRLKDSNLPGLKVGFKRETIAK